MTDIYMDTADLEEIRIGRENPLVKGFTTNPSVMRKAGVTDYEAFAKDALRIADGLPVSFEVIADDFETMERQARKIASWGNVYVKIPITNTKGELSTPLIQKLSEDGIICNVTAVFTFAQIDAAIKAMRYSGRGIISVFAGRIADSGVFPEIFIRYALEMVPPGIKVLWASPREIYNIKQAELCGCHIITVPPEMLRKYEEVRGKELNEFSLETVKQFYEDAKAAGYKL